MFSNSLFVFSSFIWGKLYFFQCLNIRLMKEKKSEKSKMHRRCFLSGCAKYAIGVSLLGYGMNSFGDTNDSYLDYSYCIRAQ
jgi:hypothetical protein